MTVEEKQVIQEETAVLKRHYSEKGGYLLRGEFYRTKRLTESRFPDFCARALLHPVPSEHTWERRRCMPRYSIQDGRG